MADISAIELPDGNVYNLKDDYLRDRVGEFRLPYRQVEWVESDGHQFLTTRFRADQDSGFDIDFALIDGVHSGLSKSRGTIDQAFVNVEGMVYTGTLFACYQKGSTKGFGISTNGASGRQGWVFCDATNKISANGSIGFYEDGRRQQASLRNRVYTAPDGTTKTLSATADFVVPYYVTVFAACENGTGTTSPIAMRLYSLKFYDGTTLVMDLIPSVRNIDDIPGLYDSVNDHFYPCAELEYGNDTGTDLGTIKTVIESIEQANPIVIDTRTQNSRIMTGRCPVLTDLRDGQQLVFESRYTYVTETSTYPGSESSSANCILDLELANNTHPRWAHIYFALGTIMTSQHGAGASLRLIYRENVLVGKNLIHSGFLLDSDYNTNTNDTARYVQWYNNIFAKKALRNNSIIVGDHSGYEEIADDVTFELSYPILWRTAALAINKTDYAYSWTMYVDRSLATIYPSVSGSPNDIVYLVGILNGGTFTVKTPLLTMTEPTIADGMYYIPIGKLGNQSNGQNYFFFSTHPNPVVMAYVDGKFQQVNRLSVDTFNSRASTTDYGLTTLSTATNSTATNIAATPSSVKIAYDLADSANGTAQQALSGVNGTLIYDHTYTIANGVATFTAHVYNKGAEVTSQFSDSDFSWSYRLDNAIGGSGTPSVISLGTGKTKTINISTLGYGGHVIGTFTTT